MKYSEENVFEGIPVGKEEGSLLTQFLNGHDFADGTVRGFVLDLRKFAKWFTNANQEPFVISRVTVRDVVDFKDYLRRERGQAVATVNRTLVLVRRFFSWLVDQGNISSNPAAKVKELRRVTLSPKGLEQPVVRKLLREVELREDVRSNAIFSLFLWTGARVSDVVQLELQDLMIEERSGSVVFRFGKGSKQRTVPLPLPARRAMEAYLATRPPVTNQIVFIGERGPLTERGFRALCDKYSAIIGVKLTPHLFRHTMAKQFLAKNENDLVSLAQILGHESLSTTARYTKRTQDELGEASDRLSY